VRRNTRSGRPHSQRGRTQSASKAHRRPKQKGTELAAPILSNDGGAWSLLGYMYQLVGTGTLQLEGAAILITTVASERRSNVSLSIRSAVSGACR